ncbi:MAG: type-F conjugative transfer system protein TraW [Proteobacteria bacterium]|nr:type-F conjugative transfer system protein TraW [Pseudomonadota bacterium]
MHKKFLILLLGTLTLKAKDLGVMGETFMIQETSLLDVIQSKLKTLSDTGKLKDLEKEIQNRIQISLKNPKAVQNIAHTKVEKTHTYDPSITVKSDLKDSQGKVFHKKGDVVNPLKQMKMTKPLLFIDGEEKSHIEWAKKKLQLNRFSKVILVKGKPFDIHIESEDPTVGVYEHPIYFDQEGILTKKLGIQNVPSIVSQKGDVLEVKEEVPNVI